MKSFVEPLLNLGSHAELLPDLSKKVKTTNIYAFILSMSALLVGALLLCLGVRLMAGLAIIIACLVLIVPLCNSWNRIYSSRVLLILILNFSIYLFATSLGRNSGTHFWFITAAISAFGIFMFSEWPYLISAVALSGLLLAFVELSQFQFVILEIPHLEIKALELISRGMIALSFLADLLFTYLIAELARSTYQTELEKSLMLASRSERSYREVWEHVPVGIFKTDLHRRFISANFAFQKMIGYTEEELKAMTTQELTHPDDQEVSDSRANFILTDFFQSVSKDAPSVEDWSDPGLVKLEKRYRNKLGEYILVEAFPQRMRFKKTDTPYILVVVKDITQQRFEQQEKEKLQERLKESYIQLLENENSFRMIFEYSPMGMFKLNSDLKFISANRAFLEFLGYSDEELRAKTILEVSPLEDREKTLERAKLFKSQPKQLDKYQKRYIHKSGKIVLGLVTAQSIKIDSEPNLALFSVVEDITEIHKLEAELKATQLGLVNASKMASLGEMASGIAHEINNPLAIIQGRAGNLLKQLVEEKFEKANGIKKLESILETGERIAKIIRGLRSFSRSAEKDPFLKVDLNTLFENVLNFCSERFKVNQVSFEISKISELQLECRITQIEQVILNLLNNAYDAIEFLPEKWIRVEVQVIGERVKISVIDSGQGIANYILDKIMDPFFTTKPVGKGTGLGLSISKGIIEDHQGKLYYEPASKNTHFVIELPLNQSHVASRG